MNHIAKQCSIALIATLGTIAIDGLISIAQAKPSPGVYVAGRDLAGAAFVGTHQYLILVPENPANFDTQDLGDGTQGIVIGAQNKTRLLVEYFETADYQATKEYSNPGKYVSWYKPDFDTEVHKVNIGTTKIDDAIKKLEASVDHYIAYEKKHNHPYPSTKETLANGSTLLNSNSWAQSIIEYNFGKNKVVENFVGQDHGHQNRFPKAYFIP